MYLLALDFAIFKKKIGVEIAKILTHYTKSKGTRLIGVLFYSLKLELI